MTVTDLGSRARRNLSAAFVACALATLTLLANHPGSGAHTFAELLKAEASSQRIDAIVHGGFIAILSALTVCFVFLARHLGQEKVPVVIGLVALCIGTGTMIASMVVDGLVIPEIATRFAGSVAPDQIASARTIFVLCGALIRFLMPMALAFQAVAMLGFSSAWLVQPRKRVPGIYGLLVGTLLIVALLIVPAPLLDHLLMLSIVLQAIWYLAIAVALRAKSAEGRAPKI